MSQNPLAHYGLLSPSGANLVTGARQEQAKRPGQPLDPAHLSAAYMRDASAYDGSRSDTSPALYGLRQAHDARLELVGRLSPKHGELPAGDLESVTPATLAAFDCAQGRWRDVRLTAVMILWGILSSAEVDSIVRRAFADFEEVYPQYPLAKIVTELAAWGDGEAEAWRAAQRNAPMSQDRGRAADHGSRHVARLLIRTGMPGATLCAKNGRDIRAALQNTRTPGRVLATGGTDTYIHLIAQMLTETAISPETIWSLSLSAFRHRSNSGVERLRNELAQIRQGILVADHAELLQPRENSDDQDLLDELTYVSSDTANLSIVILYRLQVGETHEAALDALDLDNTTVFPRSLDFYSAEHALNSIREHMTMEWAALKFGFSVSVTDSKAGPFVDAVALERQLECDLELLAMPGIGVEAVEEIRRYADDPTAIRDWVSVAKDRYKGLSNKATPTEFVQKYRPLIEAALKEAEKLLDSSRPLFTEKAGLKLITRSHIVAALLGSPRLRFRYPYSSQPDDHSSHSEPEKNGHHRRIIDLKPGMSLPNGQTLNGESLDQPRRARKPRAG